MYIYRFLLLIFIGKTLTLSSYKAEAGSISFSDDASVSANLGGIGGKFKKNIGLKAPHDLLSIFGLNDKSNNNEIDLNIEGGIRFKPKLSLGGDDGSFGISLHGNSSLGGNIEGNHVDRKTPFRTEKISTNLGVGMSTDVANRKHDSKYIKYKSHKQRLIKYNGSKRQQGLGKTNWTVNDRLGENKNSYWNKEDIIVIPFFDEEKLDEDVNRKSQNSDNKMHSTKGNNLDDNIKDIVDEVFIIPLESSEESGKMSSSSNKRNERTKDYSNYDEEKSGRGNKHIGRKEIVTISYSKDKQFNYKNKGHNNGNRNNNRYIEKSKENKIENGEEIRDHDSHVDTGGKEDIAMSHDENGQHIIGDKGYNNHENKNNSYIRRESGIVTLHGCHNKSKKHKSSKETKTKSSEKKGGCDSSHDKYRKVGGQARNGSNDVKKENINHNNGKGILAIANEGYGSRNQSKSSTERGSLVNVKDSNNHEKNNGHLHDYGEIFSTGKCGSNIKSTLQLV